MIKKVIAAGIIAAMLSAGLYGCSSGQASENKNNQTLSGEEQSSNSGGSDKNTDGNSADKDSAAVKFDIVSETVEENENTVAVKLNGKLTGEGADVTVEAAEENTITFNGKTAKSSADGVEIKGATASITKSGTYVVTGSSSDGQLIVDTDDKETVWIILANADITNSTNSPIYIVNAEKTIISAATGTENVLTDAKAYEYESVEAEEPNACIFSKDDLVISGNGRLIINGNFNNGIASKDTLEINDTELIVNAKNNGIKGKDYLIIKSGKITVNSEGDGMKSDNTSDAALGYVLIERGDIAITAGEDGIQAETCLKVTGGNIDITAGESAKTGSQGYSSDISKKGIKAAVDITITGGSININSEDDSIHTNNSIQIDGGEINIASGDDGVHSDAELLINGGSIDIAQSYEGLESKAITINSGDISVISSDDGINASDGSGTSDMRGRPSMANTSASNCLLTVNGGKIYINAGGDGIDSNSSVKVAGGTLYVDGPEDNGNGALDYNGSFEMTGGALIAAGSSGMLQSVSESSSQYCVVVITEGYLNGGVKFTLKDSKGNTAVEYTPLKRYNSVVVCTPDIEKGETYTAYFNDNEEGSVEVSSIVNYIGQGSGMMNGGGMHGGGMPGGNGDFGGGHRR